MNSSGWTCLREATGCIGKLERDGRRYPRTALRELLSTTQALGEVGITFGELGDALAAAG
jgi:hypothetical protein